MKRTSRQSLRKRKQRVPETDPIPIRPPGYFANVDSAAELKDANKLAKASVARAPRDLE